MRTTTAAALAAGVLTTLSVTGTATAADADADADTGVKAEHGTVSTAAAPQDVKPAYIPRDCKAKAVVKISKKKKAVAGGAKISCKKWKRHQIQAILFKNGKGYDDQVARGPEKGRKDCKTQNRCGVYTKAVKDRKGSQKWCVRAEFFLAGKSTIKWSCKYA
ncbi:hypothetical protein [Streptomyces sp. NPDC002851]